MWNWSLTNVFGFDVSGFSPVGGTLFRLKTEGPTIITGGYFGPEGGIIGTIFMSVGIFIIIIFQKKKFK